MLGARDHERDATTALVLVAALGTGALFLALNTTYATAAFSLLFGSIVGITRAQVWETGVLALGCIAVLAVLYRPLLFASVSPASAAARGVPVRLLGVLFLVVVGVAAAVTVPTAGTLLIFSLMIGPAAAAVQLARRPGARCSGGGAEPRRDLGRHDPGLRDGLANRLLHRHARHGRVRGSAAPGGATLSWPPSPGARRQHGRWRH